MTPQPIPIKVSIFGGPGVGKSTTAALLSAAISSQFCNRAPVLVNDTELAWKFMKRRIFDVEKIELLQRNEKSFVGMLESLREAEKRDCCVWIVDSLTPIWTELLETFHKKTRGYMDYGDWSDLKAMWREYVDFFLNTKMTCITLGRIGDETTEVQDEKNPERTKRIVTGAQFKAGGGKNSFGYEAHLLLEMSLERKAKVKAGSKLEGEGRMIHRADVIKDRTWELNGHIARWSDKDGYQAGGFRQVWESIKPHWEFEQATGSNPQLQTSSTAEIVTPESGSDYYERKALLEEWDATIEAIAPGMTSDAKNFRRIISEEVTGLRSRTRFEGLSLPKIEAAVLEAMQIEQRLKDGDRPNSEIEIRELVRLNKNELPTGRKGTLLELLLKKSVSEAVERKSATA